MAQSKTLSKNSQWAIVATQVWPKLAYPASLFEWAWPKLAHPTSLFCMAMANVSPSHNPLLSRPAGWLIATMYTVVAIPRVWSYRDLKEIIYLYE